MDKNSNNKKYVAEIINLTASIIDQLGPRIPGSDACIKAASYLKEEFKKVCDYAYLHQYDQYPGSFYNITNIIVITYLLASIFYFFQGIYIHLASFVYSIGLFYFIHQFVFLGTFFDRFFKKAPGYNVIGILEPQNKVRQQIIICGHHDSTHICNFLEKNQSFYSFRLITPMLFFCYANITSVITSAHKIAGIQSPQFYKISSYIICLGFLFILPLLKYHNKEGTPGAGDNLISSIMCAKIAKYIQHTHGRLKNTRLILLSTDGEEIGQKGSRAFVNHFKKEIKQVKTYIFNFDSIYKKEDLALLKSERNGTIKLSDSLLEEAKSLSEKFGYTIKIKNIPFGGGGTDAGQFARVGIETLSLIGISTDLIRKDIYYHTSNDIVKNIEVKALETVFNISVQFILNKDNAI